MTYPSFIRRQRVRLVRNLALLTGLALPFQVLAEQASIAVASNFSKPMTALQKEFEKESGHMLSVSFGSSGRMYAQIINGAPFDVFLSADEAKANALELENLTLATPQIYATGRIVLWYPDAGLTVDSFNSLEDPLVNKIAIANPRLAPYGQAAMQALENVGIYSGLQSKLVMGENIAQAYQFVYTRSAQVGIVALSQVLGAAAQDDYWIVPDDLHEPIRQSVALLKRASNNQAATEFFDFLLSPAAVELIARFGYNAGIEDRAP